MRKFSPLADSWSGQIVNNEPQKHSRMIWVDTQNFPTHLLPFVRKAILNYLDGIGVNYSCSKTPILLNTGCNPLPLLSFTFFSIYRASFVLISNISHIPKQKPFLRTSQKR